MILSIVQGLFGFLLLFFLPGFLITLVAFKTITLLERICLSVVLSLGIAILIGLFLGGSSSLIGLTGGITEFNVWFYQGLVTTILFCIYLAKERPFLTK